MTPIEQSGLPWVTMARRDAIVAMRDHAIEPLGKAAARETSNPMGPSCTIAPLGQDGTLALNLAHRRFDHGTTIVQARIIIHPDCLRALDHDPLETKGPRVAAVMLRIMRSLEEAPLVRTPEREEDVLDVPGRPRAIHAASRLRSRLTVPLVPDEAITAHAATPLGQGGVHVAAHPSDARRGTLVDVSPDLCMPGAVSVRHLRKRHTQLDQTTIMLHIGDPSVMFDAETPDPLAMLRMESEHPWNPAHVRIDRNRPEGDVPKALRA